MVLERVVTSKKKYGGTEAEQQKVSLFCALWAGYGELHKRLISSVMNSEVLVIGGYLSNCRAQIGGLFRVYSLLVKGR